MSMNSYQEAAMTFAVYEDKLYPVLGLSEECGEVSRLFAKATRGDSKYVIKTMDGDLYPTEYFNDTLKKELSDVLWMVSAIAHDSGWKLQDIADLNIKKLTGRKVKGIIKGDGDNR